METAKYNHIKYLHPDIRKAKEKEKTKKLRMECEKLSWYDMKTVGGGYNNKGQKKKTYK